MPTPVDPASFDAFELRAHRLVYLGLASRWGLSGHEALVLLGEPYEDEPERRERLRLLVGVTRVLQFLYPRPAEACAFLREAHPAFAATPPLQLMLAEGLDGITRVQTYLVEQAQW